MSYFEELQNFLTQASTNDLKTSHYLKNYLGLKVKVSFGQGNQSRVPWIAFLNDVDTVQEGIYPVYLYYKDKKLLILAYGISETFQPNRNWPLTERKTIDDYFEEKGLGVPERYGNSYVYKAYDIDQGLNSNIVDSDLNEIIDFYKKANHTLPKPYSVEPFKYQSFIQNSHSSGLAFYDKTILRFVAALLTKPFVILTGLSGSGKTKLAQAFAMWICENRNQYCLVPVGADWTNREPLLGFPNALKEREYVKPENRVLDIIIGANNNLTIQSGSFLAYFPGSEFKAVCPVSSSCRTTCTAYSAGYILEPYFRE